MIRAALADLALCEADEVYRIDMDHWHQPNHEDGLCEVCFAGAVMAKSLGADNAVQMDPGSYEGYPDTTIKLFTLNRLREGDLARAFINLRKVGEFHASGLPATVSITLYEESPLHFRVDMLALADRLEKAGF